MATLGALILRLGIAIHRRLPRALDLRLTALLGFLFGRVARGMRSALIENLQMILGLSKNESDRLADDVFRNFALTLHDFFIPNGISIEVPGRDRVERARAHGKGVIILTFHLGNWELGARTMQSWGWPVTAVYQPYRNQEFKKLIESSRAPGVNFVPVGGKAATGVRDALRRGDVVAMLGDHPFGEQGVPVDVLGKRVLWPRGPVLLAVREKCPIVVATIVRVGRQQYRALVEEPMLPQNGTLDEVDRLVQEIADKFGSVVRSYPSQWYRFRAFESAPAASERSARSGRRTAR